MKRRNLDAGKPPRRPNKRSNKFTDGVYGSSFVFLKFIAMWLFILLADFILEFRFEYIWPFWLFVQSVYETFKYHGLFYAVLFVCVAIVSDTICLLFIPVQWLFFMASTYVWLHYVWNTEKGICIPTISMWVVIMYVEATVRQRDLKSSQLHIDLCQPFAAHCIGHPVVTLGMGFRSYINYRLKLRTQRKVAKENSFYYELLKRALPRELHFNHTLAVTDKEKNEVVAPFSGILSSGSKKSQKSTSVQDATLQIAEASTTVTPTKNSSTITGTSSTPSSQRRQSSHNNLHSIKTSSENSLVSYQSSATSPDVEVRRRNTASSQSKKLNASEGTAVSSQSNKSSSKSASGDNSPKFNKNASFTRTSNSNDGDKQKNNVCSNDSSVPSSKELSVLTTSLTNGHAVSTRPAEAKVELISTPSVMERLEATIAKLRAELSIARKSDLDLKNQIDSLTSAERAAKSELNQLRKEHESLQMKMNTLVNSKQKDKHNIQSMEKRLKTEVDNRESAEKNLYEERRRRKEDEENASRAAVIAQNNRDKETAEAIKRATKEFEDEIKSQQKKLEERDDECMQLKKEIGDLQSNDKLVRESETLMSALEAMREKNKLLEKSLSAETRLKLDLFSALGDVKRQLELSHVSIFKRDAEIGELKARLSDFLAVLPEQRLRSPTPHYSANFLEQLTPTQEYTTPFHHMPRTPVPAAAMVPVHPVMEQGMVNHVQTPPHLDPNAAMYSPNTSGI